MPNDLEDLYRILEVESGATLSAVKRSYRELVKVWHPDRFGHDPALKLKAQEKLKQINLAFERLEEFFARNQEEAKRPENNPDAHRAENYFIEGQKFFLERESPKIWLGLLICFERLRTLVLLPVNTLLDTLTIPAKGFRRA